MGISEQMSKINWPLANSNTVLRVVIGLLIGCSILYFNRARLIQPGHIYLGDATSNLYPALQARWSLSHGHLPIYTDLWYGGRYQFVNPLWKGFYPPAWPMYIPGIPLLPVTKFLLAGHCAAAAGIAYWYASDDFPATIAIPFAAVFVLPGVAFGGQYEYVFAWPWFVLLVWQLTPPRLFETPHRSGLITGVALAALLLTGANYHFFYAGVLLACVVGATKTWVFAGRVCLGALVGLPKLVFSILPVLFMGTGRPTGGASLSVIEFITALIGFWIDPSTGTITGPGQFRFGGYGTIGLGAVVLAACTLVYAYFRVHDRQNTAWLLGVTAALVLGTLLASRWGYLYKLPVVSTFRVGARAIVLVSLSLLLLCWHGLWTAIHLPGTSSRRRQIATVFVTVLIASSAASGMATWSTVSTGDAIQTQIGTTVADDIEAAGCSAAWIEGGRSPAGTSEYMRTPYGKQVGYRLLERGIPLTAVNYGKIGQQYSTHKNGRLTFNALVIGTKLPEAGSVTLTGGWGSPARGTIQMSRFDLEYTHQTDRGTLYVYTGPTCGH